MNNIVKKLEKLIDQALELDEVPVAAIITVDDKIVSSAINLKHSSKNPCDHAEIIAINQFCNYQQDWRIENSAIYVNLFPCVMCYGAIVASRIEKIYYFDDSPQMKQLVELKNLNHYPQIEKLELKFKYQGIVSNFFKKRRKTNG